MKDDLNILVNGRQPRQMEDDLIFFQMEDYNKYSYRIFFEIFFVFVDDISARCHQNFKFLVSRIKIKTMIVITEYILRIKFG